MACEDDKKRKCFTFIWKVENADYWWKTDYIMSPAFIVEGIGETNWKLCLWFDLYNIFGGSKLYLHTEGNDKCVDKVEINCDLAFLSTDGTVLHTLEEKNSVIGGIRWIGCDGFPSRNEVFFTKRSVFLSQNTLTVRCRMWKSVGEITKNVQCFARTRLAVEKRSYLWNIRDFSILNRTQTYEVNSLETGEELIRLELFITRRRLMDEIISLKIIPNFQKIKIATLQLSIVDASKNATKCFQEELSVEFPYDSKEYVLFHSKRELMKKKTTYLPNDVLSLFCECSVCFGNLVEEIEGSSFNSPVIQNIEQDDGCLGKANDLPVSKAILIDQLKSMLNDSVFSDVRLKTRSKTYPAHKLILSYRSPVFKAMFSNGMREKINDCVDIDDLSDDSVLHMLRYIYSADVEELEWGRATELYEAADKYQILDLKDICSSYLKTNLCPNNACEALVLADLHQDVDLKRFVQDLILRHGKGIINSVEWKQLMESDLKLAAETMCLKFKE